MKYYIVGVWAAVCRYAYDVRWPFGWKTIAGLAVFSLLSFVAYRARFETMGRIGYALIAALACSGFLWFVPATGLLWWVSTFFASTFFVLVLLLVSGSKKTAKEEEEEEEPYH